MLAPKMSVDFRVRSLAALACLSMATFSVSTNAEEPSPGAAEPSRYWPDTDAEKPNIVIIYADDLGFGDVGAYNSQSRIATPAIDVMAQNGLKFTDGHSSAATCSPSRYALLTGRYHWRNSFDFVRTFGASYIQSQTLTLPEMLQQSGYATAAIGKWHLGWDWATISTNRRPATEVFGIGATPEPADFDWSQPIRGGPIDHGFDYYFGDDVPNFPPYTWLENDRVLGEPTLPLSSVVRPDEGDAELRPGPMSPGWRIDEVMPTITRRALGWIEHQSSNDQPFFLYFSLTAPHTPIVPTAEFRGTSEAGPYGDYVRQTDAVVGMVMAKLAELGLLDDTLVILTSDNGPEHYAYARSKKWGHDSAGPLRGVKRDLWEGGHRVPFIVHWPDVIPAGQTSDAIISQIDLMATIGALIDYPIPSSAAEDSYNMLPHFIRPTETAGPRRVLLHDLVADPSHYAIRSGEWLYINAATGDIGPRPEWVSDATPHGPSLYNLRQDLGQARNVISDYPELARALALQYETLRGLSRTAPASPRQELGR